MHHQIQTLLDRFSPITLEEMSAIRLMNRTDAKFLTNQATLVELLARAQREYYAQEIEAKRINTYQTIYWDTAEHAYFLGHHNGRMPRVKVRVRTYVDSGLSYLEVKQKNNHGRTRKKRVKCSAIESALTTEAGDFEDFLFKTAGAGCDDLHPTLQNCFERITLVNQAKTERLTIDFNVKYRNLETRQEADTRDLVIVELKRDGNVPSPIQEILLQLRIKPSGYSKYCIGSAMTNASLKQNLFKERIIKINKLLNNS